MAEYDDRKLCHSMSHTEYVTGVCVCVCACVCLCACMCVCAFMLYALNFDNNVLVKNVLALG